MNSCLNDHTLHTEWMSSGAFTPQAYSVCDSTTIGFEETETVTTGREQTAEDDDTKAARTEFESQREAQELQLLQDDIANQITWERAQRKSKRRFRICLGLFVATFLSTTLVGADYWPLEILIGWVNPDYGAELLKTLNGIPWPWVEQLTLWDHFWMTVGEGLTYSIPLMMILLFHEMGHYLQARRYSIPASLPFFIPLPLPPLGTMGAVILQGRGKADRREMFDIAVSGPIAGLVLTIPVLLYGIMTSGYVIDQNNRLFDFGEPWIVSKAIELIHGPKPEGMVFLWNGYATAGWVGVFITALNLLPIGQLDGGHILYTLLGRPAHYVAWGLILAATGYMVVTEQYSYVLLLILVTLTGPRHPPTRNDHMPLGWGRKLVGVATLAFLLIGFTAQPIVVSAETAEPVDGWADGEQLEARF